MHHDQERAAQQPPEHLESVTIRFAGDSGDGMQLVGMELAKASARQGNDLATLPNYPAEIRAPAGSLSGVSGFQLQFGARRVYTPGDKPEVLVVMSPAALKVNLGELRPAGMIIANRDGFSDRALGLAGYSSNPLTDGSLAGYAVHAIDLGTLAETALDGLGLAHKEVARCKNYVALGLLFRMYDRAPEPELASIRARFAKKNPLFGEANARAFRAGFDYAENTETLPRYHVPPASIRPGRYRHVTGNQATALGLTAAAHLAGLRLYLGSYPISPATEILHELALLRQHRVIAFQTEDEIAAVTSCIGASFGGALAATNTSGPGLALMSEGLSLAVMLELPLVVVDVQRGGPSTGLPTKTEQADLLFAVHGRHAESPLPVLAAATPADCFEMTIEASRIALKYMTPVLLLTDGFLALSAEPWRIPEPAELPRLKVSLRTDPKGFAPSLRDPKTLARPWAVPGTPGLEHRIGGLEKDFVTGAISYDPVNHERMVEVRARKIAGIADDIAPLEVQGKPEGELLVLGWGSTYGAICAAVGAARAAGKRVSQAHLRHLNPLPRNTGEVLRRFRRVLVPENNAGQLGRLLREELLVDTVGLDVVQARPLKVGEIAEKIEELLQP